MIIRADGTTQIGTGHIMRCLALAQAWKERGGQVLFISHCESQALENLIIDEGFDLVPIKNPHPHPDDLKITLDILQRYALCSKPHASSPWLTLDGYNFTPNYQRQIRETDYRLLVIDDMANLDHYYANIILNQNIHAEQLHYYCELETRLLLGTKYALLRKEFRTWREFKRETPEKARKILVTLGGSDPDNVTLRVIEAIKRLNMPELEVQVVIGPSNPHAEELKNAVLHAPCSMLLVQNPTNIPKLMAWADLAVSAGGSTCWELSFMGLPFVTVIIAENQEKIALELEQFGAGQNAGWYHLLTEKALANLLRDLIDSSSGRSELCRKGKEVVDGKGALRVVEHMVRKSQ